MHISIPCSTFTRKPSSPVKTEKDYLIERKERDFLKAFDAVAKQYQVHGMTFKTVDICRMVANTAAPCFYVSLEQALLQYRLYRQGKSNIQNLVRRQMFAEIFVRFENLMKESNGGLFMCDAMNTVLEQPAPCFYLNDTSSVLFYYKARRKKRNRLRAS